MTEKQGLHGWKAFLIVVISGTAAALAIIGGVVLVAKNVDPSFSENPSGSMEGGQAGKWEPAPSMTEGALNLCRTLETSAQAGAFRSMGPERIDAGESYGDSISDAGYRSISDKCSWGLNSPEGEKWLFSLEYEAVAYGDSEADRVDTAQSIFSSMKNSLEEEVDPLIFEELMPDMAEESYSIYGGVRGKSDEVLYTFLGRTRSGVFRISLEAPKDRDGGWGNGEEFRMLVRKTVPVIHSRIERVLPG